eukprot:m.99832 g.99832  ORF g.99832 m.99832 type:complete len:570 (+) comp16769_c0_seq13:393-2102(+)
MCKPCGSMCIPCNTMFSVIFLAAKENGETTPAAEIFDNHGRSVPVSNRRRPKRKESKQNAPGSANMASSASLPTWHRTEVPGVATHMKYGMVPGQQYAAASLPAQKTDGNAPINVPKSQVAPKGVSKGEWAAYLQVLAKASKRTSSGTKKKLPCSDSRSDGTPAMPTHPPQTTPITGPGGVGLVGHTEKRPEGIGDAEWRRYMAAVDKAKANSRVCPPLQETISLSTVQTGRTTHVSAAVPAPEHSSPVAAVNAYLARERGKVFTATSARGGSESVTATAVPPLRAGNAQRAPNSNSPYKQTPPARADSRVPTPPLVPADSDRDSTVRDGGEPHDRDGASDSGSSSDSDRRVCNDAHSGGDAVCASEALAPPATAQEHVLGNGACDAAGAEAVLPRQASAGDMAQAGDATRHNPFTGTPTTHSAHLAPFGTEEPETEPGVLTAVTPPMVTTPEATPGRSASGSSGRKPSGRRRAKRTPLKNASADDDGWLFGLGLRQDFITQPKDTEHDVFGDAPPPPEAPAALAESPTPSPAASSGSEEEDDEPYVRQLHRNPDSDDDDLFAGAAGVF